MTALKTAEINSVSTEWIVLCSVHKICGYCNKGVYVRL